MQNQEISIIQVMLFDVSPFIYMSYFGATSNMTQGELANNLIVSKRCNIVITSKILGCYHLMDMTQPILPVFCYDGIHSSEKKKLVEAKYKAQRSNPISKEVRLSMLNTVKQFPGWHLVNDYAEADDLISTIKYKIKNISEDYLFTIFSKDNDLLQLCDYRTKFFDPAANKGFRDRKYLAEKFDGIDNFKLVIPHKVCFGDPSDNIAGVCKGKRRKPIVEKIKSCTGYKDFLLSDIFENNEQRQRAKELYSIIRLKTDIDYRGRYNPEDVMLDEDANYKFHKLDLLS